MWVSSRLLATVALAVAVGCTAHGDTLELRGGVWRLGEFDLRTPYAQRELVPVEGLDGAFRFDGNSNWLEADDVISLDPSAGLAAGAWLALAAPPGDTAAIVYLAENGLLLGVNRWGQPEMRLGDLRVAASDPLPIGEWVHVAGDYDGVTLRLRVAGVVMAEAKGDVTEPVEGLFAVGRALDAGFQQGTHPLGTINGLLAEVTFRRSAEPVRPGTRPVLTPDLETPEVWFADDPDRPRTLPLGDTTGWTNEPHALVWRNGLWHLYFQANPNGAFWRHIVWGHRVSPDLGSWEGRKPALVPSTGFDRRGVWVGNWIPNHAPPAVLYTGVNGDWAGIGYAEANESGGLNLTQVVDHDTPEEFQDMRDPWIVRTDDGWLMLIGTGQRDGSEALVYSYRSEDGETWRRAGLFDTGGAEMPGQYWELPVLIEIGDKWMLMGTPVIESTPARTVYWLGTFDGMRFLPDDPEPRQLDILGTYRAPTLARGPEGDLVAVGILADEVRDEQERHESGWVHVLTPATRLTLCADDPREVCQEFVPAFANRFSQTMEEGRNATSVTLSTDGQPVILTAEIDASAGGRVRLGARVADEGEPAAELIIDAETGTVRLDYTNGPILPVGRPPVMNGAIQPTNKINIALLIDGAAVFGSLNGRPLAFLAFAKTQGRAALHLSAEEGARILMFHLAGEGGDVASERD